MSYEAPEEEPAFPAELKGIAARMEQTMQSPAFDRFEYPIEVATDAIKEERIESFADFEKCLREIGSRVHFIAIDTYLRPQEEGEIYIPLAIQSCNRGSNYR